MCQTSRARVGSTIGLLQACHLPPTVAVTAIATALAIATHRGAGIAAVTFAVGAGQLAVGWSNDYIDRDADTRAGRLDKPIVAGRVNADTVRRGAIVALVACVPLSFLSGWRAAGVHLAAVGAALAYNLWLKKSLASPLPYALAFGALPVFVTLGLPGHPLPPLWAVAASGTFGCGAHFVNTLDDIEDDRLQNVRGLPQRLGVGVSLGVGASLLALATCILTFSPTRSPSALVLTLFFATIAILVGVVLSVATNHIAFAWPLTIASAVIAAVLLLASGTSLA